jgi:hypothetical protein
LEFHTQALDDNWALMFLVQNIMVAHKQEPNSDIRVLMVLYIVEEQFTKVALMAIDILEQLIIEQAVGMHWVW